MVIAPYLQCSRSKDRMRIPPPSPTTTNYVKPMCPSGGPLRLRAPSRATKPGVRLAIPWYTVYLLTYLLKPGRAARHIQLTVDLLTHLLTYLLTYYLLTTYLLI